MEVFKKNETKVCKKIFENIFKASFLGKKASILALLAFFWMFAGGFYPTFVKNEDLSKIIQAREESSEEDSEEEESEEEKADSEGEEDEEDEEDDELSEEEKEEAEKKKKEKEKLSKEEEEAEEEVEEASEAVAGAESQWQQINRQVINTRYEIQKTQEAVESLESQIKKQSQKINNIDKNIQFKKQILSEYLRHYRKGVSEMGMNYLDSGKDIGDYLKSLDSYEDIQSKIGETLDKIKADKQMIEEKKKAIEEKKQAKAEVRENQESQKQRLERQESQKQEILNERKEEVSEKQATLSELRAKIAQVESELSSLLKESYDTDDILEAAEFASDATGVRKDFLLGMLVVESDLGRYTGGCTYEEVKDGAKDAYKSGRLSQGSYDLMKKRKDLFEDIVDELDYDEDEVKVSCNPSNYVGTGGAMGVAQFMADTWMGYKSDIVSHTGHNPPDPWSLADGVTAMALKLDKVDGVDDHEEDAECYAAKLYLGSTSADWYCDRIFYWADNYEDKL
ncbi:MAG: hypothetical protein ACOCUF_00285 [Patescibacteria group bacterium]